MTNISGRKCLSCELPSLSAFLFRNPFVHLLRRGAAFIRFLIYFINSSFFATGCACKNIVKSRKAVFVMQIVQSGRKRQRMQFIKLYDCDVHCWDSHRLQGNNHGHIKVRPHAPSRGIPGIYLWGISTGRWIERCIGRSLEYCTGARKQTEQKF